MDLNDYVSGVADSKPNYGFSSYNYYRHSGEFTKLDQISSQKNLEMVI